MPKAKSQYDSTLHLPKTLFEMRAGLPKKEPVMLEDWNKNDLYNQLMKHNEGKPTFVLHDGPPYANGNIHMGHRPEQDHQGYHHPREEHGRLQGPLYSRF